VYYCPTLGAECVGVGEHIHPERKKENQQGASASFSMGPVRDGASSRIGENKRKKETGWKKFEKRGDKEGNSRCDMLDDNRG
jgi:hypothetical protein